MWDENTVRVEGDTDAYYEIVLTVTDNNGCQVSQTFTHTEEP